MWGRPQGLGDLAAHLVAFHNMGASPSHDDPFASGTAKVSFDDGDGTQAGDGSAHSPVHAHSQRHNAAPLIEQDHPFDGSDQVRFNLTCQFCDRFLMEGN